MHLFSSKFGRITIVAVIALLAIAGLFARQRGQLEVDSVPAAPTLEPLPQDPDIQVFINHSESISYTEPYRQQQRLGDDLEQIIVEAIASAQSTVDIAIQELRLPRIAAALIERQQAGVQVRVILENNYSRPWSSYSDAEIRDFDARDRGKYSEFLALADQDGDGQVSDREAQMRDALAMLYAAEVPWIDDTADGSKGSDLMHHKFLVVDGQVVVTGSANFTTSGIHGDFFNPGSRGNANHLLRINSRAIAQIFTDEFNLLWGDGPGGQPDSLFGLQKPPRSPQTVTVGASTVTVQFSPISSSQDWSLSGNGLIGRSLSTAQQSIDMALFVFSDQNLSNLLQTRQPGVDTRVLVDPSFIYRPYSEALDMLGVALPSRECRYEDNNQPWGTPIRTVGTPQLPDGDVLHHKMGIIDGRTVITGSQNWSNAANHSNDETVLIIENPVVAAHLQREFDRLYRDANLGIPDWLNDKVREANQQCS